MLDWVLEKFPDCLMAWSDDDVLLLFLDWMKGLVIFLSIRVDIIRHKQLCEVCLLDSPC